MIKTKPTKTTWAYEPNNKAFQTIVDSVTIAQMKYAFGEPTGQQGNHWHEWMFHIDGLAYQYGIAFANGEPRLRTYTTNNDYSELHLSVFLSFLTMKIKNL